MFGREAAMIVGCIDPFADDGDSSPAADGCGVTVAAAIDDGIACNGALAVI